MIFFTLLTEGTHLPVYRNFRQAFRSLILCLLLVILIPAGNSPAQTPSTPATEAAPTLRIDGVVSTSLVLTVADLKLMPRKALTVTNSHEKKTATYEGVLLEELLKRAGVPQDEQLHGKSLATYVIALA